MSKLLKLVKFLVRSSGRRGASRFLVVLLIGAGVVAGLASTGLLALIHMALGDPDTAGLGWAFAALCIVLPLARFVSSAFLVRLTQGLMRDLRLDLGRKILQAPMRELEKWGPPRLLAILTEDVTTLTSALGDLPLVFLQLAVIVSCLGYMAWLSPELLGLFVACAALGILAYQIPVSRALGYLQQSREGMDDIMDHFRGLTEGTKELKVHRPRREAFQREKLAVTAEFLRRKNVVGGTIYAASNSAGQVLFFLLIGVVLFVLPRFVDVGAAVISGYVLAILYLLTPLDVVLNLIPRFGRALVSLDKIEDLGLSLAAGRPDDGAAPLAIGDRGFQTVRLSGVTHSYYREDLEDSFTLGPIDLTLTPGELVFVVGGNGSGKTTLAKLLIGLYTPDQGSVEVDGARVTDADRDSYRQLFSVIFSDFFLFESILGVGAREADEAARAYLADLHLEHKVRIEGGEFSTTRLSQGQRKRLALLAAYLEDRPIYVFDEWAADQDPQFKETFYCQILPALRARGKTVVVISHDDRYFEVGDRLIKFDYGQIVYDGPSSGSREDAPDRSDTRRLAAAPGGEPLVAV